MDKKIIQFDDTEIEKYKFRQYESSILIGNIDINKIVVLNMVSFGKKDFNILVAIEILKELDLYEYYFQK